VIETPPKPPLSAQKRPKTDKNHKLKENVTSLSHQNTILFDIERMYMISSYTKSALLLFSLLIVRAFLKYNTKGVISMSINRVLAFALLEQRGQVMLMLHYRVKSSNRK
jgi:hypothetical protein